MWTHILSSIIRYQTLNRSTALIFNQCPKLLESFKYMTLVVQEIDPSEMKEIIDKCHNKHYTY